jgi:Ca2+:H+ antiporter
VTGWTVAVPVASALLLGGALYLPLNPVLILACVAALMAVVVAAVHHAEVVAHRVGEPFGTLVLALAITVIDVALVVSMMLAAGAEKAALARDSVYAAVMLICTGVVGACVLAGALRHREQSFRLEGAGPALAALVTLATMVLILPVFTTSAPGPRYSTAQLAFTAVASFSLWAVFVFVQTIRHRDTSCLRRRRRQAPMPHRPLPGLGRLRAPARVARRGGPGGLRRPSRPWWKRSRRPGDQVAIATLVLLPEASPPCARRSRTDYRRA